MPLAILSNSSCFDKASVRKAVKAADLIVPSLDAVSEDIFAKIDRPLKGIKLAGIIKGLVALRKEFPGKIWLEVMLVRGVNDGLAHARKLKEAMDKSSKKKVYIQASTEIPLNEIVNLVRLSEGVGSEYTYFQNY